MMSQHHFPTAQFQPLKIVKDPIQNLWELGYKIHYHRSHRIMSRYKEIPGLKLLRVNSIRKETNQIRMRQDAALGIYEQDPKEMRR